MILKIKNAEKSFGGVLALRHLSFHVEEGKITSIIGPNGAGKTTLFNAVCGFLTLDRGSLEFDGADITNLPAWKRSRLGLSRTFQQSRNFYNLTLRENLLLSIRQDDDQFFRMVFRRNTMHEYDDMMRKTMALAGLEKSLDTKVTELSYGEQKLFDLSRALLNPHTVLLLDEPVAGVNPVLREKMKDILKLLREGEETILLIEHDMDFVRAVADHVIVLDQGSVLAEGKAEDVLCKSEVLEAYLGN